MVCLGGYGTHWVPSVQLDELCTMLWDMLRYHNYDIRSPYNRDAALWVAQQQTFRFPTDERPLRDLRAALGRVSRPRTAGPRRIVRSRRRGSAGTGGDSEGRLSRVRNFAQRDGRVFGARAEEPGSRAAGARRAGRAAAVQLRTARPGGGPGGRRGAGCAAPAEEPVFILEPESPAETRPAAAGGGGRTRRSSPGRRERRHPRARRRSTSPPRSAG